MQLQSFPVVINISRTNRIKARRGRERIARIILMGKVYRYWREERPEIIQGKKSGGLVDPRVGLG